MQLETLRAYLLSRPGAAEDRPFGPQTLVIKVGGKIFALVSEDATPLDISLKCEPAHAQFLRDSFPAVRPGYHLNKEHWNTVTLDGSIADDGIRAMIEESYRLGAGRLRQGAQRRFVGGGEGAVRPRQ